MSNVSGVISIIALVDGDQVSIQMHNTKSLYQYIKKDTTSVLPDWTKAENQPIIYPYIKSQNSGVRMTVVDGTEVWTYNGATILFDASGKSTSPAGMFQKMTYDFGGVLVPALKLIGNLASPTNTDNDNIGFAGKVLVGTTQSDVNANATVRLEEVVGDPHTGYIDATDGGVIDDDTSKIICTAYLYKGGALVESAVTYQYYKRTASGWQALSSDTGIPKQKTFTESDIDSEMTIRVDYIIDGVVVYSATRQLTDETDPFILQYSVSNGLILKNGESTTITPSVIRRGTGETITGYTYSYGIYNALGAKIRDASGSQLTISWADAVACSMSMNINITATK